MSLRLKLLFTTGATLAVMVGTLWFAGKSILLSGFQRSEEIVMRRTSELLGCAALHETVALENMASNIARRDDARQFLQTGNSFQFRNEFNSLLTPDFHLLAVADAKGQIVLGRALDMNGHTSLAVLASIQSRFTPQSPIMETIACDKPRTGLIKVPQGVMLAAIRPVRGHEDKMPASGFIIAGRWLNAHEVISGISNSFPRRPLVKAWSADHPELPSDFAKAGRMMTDDAPFFEPQNNSQMKVYAILPDLDGSTAAILRIIEPRDLHLLGVRAFSLMSGIIIALGIIFLFLVCALQERIILLPLARLSTKVRAIGSAGSLSARVAMGGNNEIGRLSNETDRMLTLLEKRQQSLIESEERYRTLVENMNMGISLIDKEHRIVMTNTAHARFFRKRPRDMIGKHCFSEFEKKEAVCLHCPGVQAMAVGCTAEVLTTGVRDDGSTFDVRIMAFPLSGFDGKPRGFIEVVEDISGHIKLEKTVQDYQEKLKMLAFELTLTENRTRSQLAVELHDMIGQSLCMAKLKLQKAIKAMAPGEDSSCLGETVELLDSAIASSRKMVFELHPPILSDLGLPAALKWLVEQINARDTLVVKMKEHNEIPPLSTDISMLLFSTARELLMNVIKHASASEAMLSLWVSDDFVHISVEDNGRGCARKCAQPVDENTKSRRGFGLFCIRERVELIGGHLKFESAPRSGVKAEVAVPAKLAFI